MRGGKVDRPSATVERKTSYLEETSIPYEKLTEEEKKIVDLVKGINASATVLDNALNDKTVMPFMHEVHTKTGVGTDVSGNNQGVDAGRGTDGTRVSSETLGTQPYGLGTRSDNLGTDASIEKIVNAITTIGMGIGSESDIPVMAYTTVTTDTTVPTDTTGQQYAQPQYAQQQYPPQVQQVQPYAQQYPTQYPPQDQGTMPPLVSSASSQSSAPSCGESASVKVEIAWFQILEDFKRFKKSEINNQGDPAGRKALYTTYVLERLTLEGITGPSIATQVQQKASTYEKYGLFEDSSISISMLKIIDNWFKTQAPGGVVPATRAVGLRSLLINTLKETDTYTLETEKMADDMVQVMLSQGMFGDKALLERQQKQAGEGSTKGADGKTQSFSERIAQIYLSPEDTQ